VKDIDFDRHQISNRAELQSRLRLGQDFAVPDAYQSRTA
jgi:hypothetical protein